MHTHSVSKYTSSVHSYDYKPQTLKKDMHRHHKTKTANILNCQTSIGFELTIG